MTIISKMANGTLCRQRGTGPHQLPQRLTTPVTGKATGPRRYLQDVDVWQEAPVLTGSTKFEPRPDVKNIMITGGAGFM